jgi:hypothetical protein
MKAVLLDAPGPPSSLRIGELADPALQPDEVLVRVHFRVPGSPPLILSIGGFDLN